MILLHILLGLAFVLQFFISRRVDGLQEAMKTQEKINMLLTEQIVALGEELEKKSNKRVKKT